MSRNSDIREHFKKELAARHHLGQWRFRPFFDERARVIDGKRRPEWGTDVGARRTLAKAIRDMRNGVEAEPEPTIETKPWPQGHPQYEYMRERFIYGDAIANDMRNAR